MMKYFLTKCLMLASMAILLFNCNQAPKSIQIDKEPVPNITSENAKQVIDFAESKLKDISSIHAEWTSSITGGLYDNEILYKGKIAAEFGGAPGTLGNLYYDTNQSAKGKKSHIQGIKTATESVELFLMKKKAVIGDEKAYPEAWIAGIYEFPLNDKNYYNRLRDYSSDKEFSNSGKIKTTTYLEKIEKIFEMDCYVLRTEYSNNSITHRDYFGLENGLYYGYSNESKDDNNKSSIMSYWAQNVEINKTLPDFNLEIPANFETKQYVSQFDMLSLTEGIMAPDWTLKNDKGTTQTFSEEYKNNVVLLDFWATWCGPCKAKMPFVQKLKEKYGKKGFKVISVLAKDKGHEKQAQKYLKQKQYTFDLVYATKAMEEAYKIRFLPTVALVDKTGKIIFFKDTAEDYKEALEEMIKKNLDE